MGNMLLVLDKTCPDMNALDFACYVSKSTKRALKIISLKKGLDHSALVVSLWPSLARTVNEATEPYATFHPAAFSHGHEECLQACQDRGITATWNGPDEMGFTEIISQTRFADLLVVGAGTSMQEGVSDHLTALVKSLVQQAECPVLIPPNRCTHIDRIVFAYNGTKSSAFAIKQFSYLFPQFADKSVTLLEINQHYDCKAAERMGMQEWLQSHYKQAFYEKWQGHTAFTLFRYFLGKDNQLLVMGSFGRPLLTRVLKPDVSTPVLIHVNVPVFITHH